MTYYQLEQRDRDYLDSLFKQFKDELDWACTTTDRRARCAPYPDEWELVDLVRSLVRYGRIAQLGITCKGTEDIQIYHEYLTCQEWFARITYTHSHRSGGDVARSVEISVGPFTDIAESTIKARPFLDQLERLFHTHTWNDTNRDCTGQFYWGKVSDWKRKPIDQDRYELVAEQSGHLDI